MGRHGGPEGPLSATPNAQLIYPDIDTLINQYTTNKKDEWGQAAQEFLSREAHPWCAYTNDRFTYSSEPVETILVGDWKSHNQSGLFVRVGIESGRISLAKNHHSDELLHWIYEWRGDQEERGFLHTQYSLALEDLPKIQELVEKFTSALEGYHQIILSRK